MKTKLELLAITWICVALSQCTSPSTNNGEVQEQEQQPVVESCTYSYDNGSTEVLWVAYKFTEKTGVKGVFDSLWVDGVTVNESRTAVFEHVNFKIATGSTNSGDPTRDPKIVQHFFGTMQGTDYITGKVIQVDGDDSKGTIEFEVEMNGIIAPMKGIYSIDDTSVEIKAEMDVNTWQGGDAITALNKECAELHTGTDGQSKLWSTVSLFISTTLKKDCSSDPA